MRKTPISEALGIAGAQLAHIQPTGEEVRGSWHDWPMHRASSETEGMRKARGKFLYPWSVTLRKLIKLIRVVSYSCQVRKHLMWCFDHYPIRSGAGLSSESSLCIVFSQPDGPFVVSASHEFIRRVHQHKCSCKRRRTGCTTKEIGRGGSWTCRCPPRVRAAVSARVQALF